MAIARVIRLPRTPAGQSVIFRLPVPAAERVPNPAAAGVRPDLTTAEELTALQAGAFIEQIVTVPDAAEGDVTAVRARLVALWQARAAQIAAREAEAVERWDGTSWT